MGFLCRAIIRLRDSPLCRLCCSDSLCKNLRKILKKNSKNRENFKVGLELVEKRKRVTTFNRILISIRNYCPPPSGICWPIQFQLICSTDFCNVAPSRRRRRLLLLLPLLIFTSSVCVYLVCIRLFGIALSRGCYQPAGRK